MTIVDDYCLNARKHSDSPTLMRIVYSELGTCERERERRFILRLAIPEIEGGKDDEKV